jgi:adenosine/AMP kinase
MAISVNHVFVVMLRNKVAGKILDGINLVDPGSVSLRLILGRMANFFICVVQTDLSRSINLVVINNPMMHPEMVFGGGMTVEENSAMPVRKSVACVACS